MVSLSVQLSEMRVCMNGLKLVAFLSIADMTQVESPIVETVATALGKTHVTLYCSLVASTNVDISDLGIVSPSFKGVTLALAMTI